MRKIAAREDHPMKWEGDAESSNVEDRRGMGGPIAVGGGITGVLALVVYLLTGFNFNGGGGAPEAAPDAAQQTKEVQFVKVVLHYTEEVWGAEFAKHHKRYREPKLDLFTGHVNSACGLADAAVGPFYCPGDDKVYI